MKVVVLPDGGRFEVIPPRREAPAESLALMNRVTNLPSFTGPARRAGVEYEIDRDESVSTAVVRAVSAVAGREPRSLRPLAEVLDPAALDALFDSRGDGTPRVGGRLSFVYGDCSVTIEHGEYLTLHLLETGLDGSSRREPSHSRVR